MKNMKRGSRNGSSLIFSMRVGSGPSALGASTATRSRCSTALVKKPMCTRSMTTVMPVHIQKTPSKPNPRPLTPNRKEVSVRTKGETKFSATIPRFMMA